MFEITGCKGFRLTFENGLTVSVQFGPGNYCERRDDGFGCVNHDHHESRDAEVAVLTDDGSWVAEYPHWSDGDTVCGWLSANQIADIITWAASRKLGEWRAVSGCGELWNDEDEEG